MTTERDPATRLVLSWLREDAYENAEGALLRALDEVDTTPQRRSWWPPRRFFDMQTLAKVAIGAAALLVVALVAIRIIPVGAGVGGQPAPTPSIAPSPSPALLASGTFQFPAMGAAVELEATGQGSDVTGTMTVSGGSGSFTVDLDCALTTEDGRIMIGGDATASTYGDAPTGTRIAIVLKPGSPVRTIFAFQGSDPRAPSCTAFLEDMNALTTSPEPIEGTVEFGP